MARKYIRVLIIKKSRKRFSGILIDADFVYRTNVLSQDASSKLFRPITMLTRRISCCHLFFEKFFSLTSAFLFLIRLNQTMNEFLFFQHGEHYLKLKLSEILFVQEERKHVLFVTRAKSYPAYYSMDEVEKMLPSTIFFRVHPSYIISVLHADMFDDRYIYVGKKRIPMERRYKNILINSVNILASGGKPTTFEDGDVDRLLRDIDP